MYFVHLMRLFPCHADSEAGSALADWDTQLQGMLSNIVGGPRLDGLSSGIAALSVQNGGLGLVPTALLADSCLVGGKLAAAKTLAEKCAPLSLASASLTDLSAEPMYPTETAVHAAIDRMDELSFGLRESLESRTVRHLQRHLAKTLDDVRKHDLIAGQSTSTRALIRSNAGDPHVLAVPHSRSPATAFPTVTTAPTSAAVSVSLFRRSTAPV